MPLQYQYNTVVSRMSPFVTGVEIPALLASSVLKSVCGTWQGYPDNAGPPGNMCE